MTNPNESVVMIIDAFPLRSLGFISSLNYLNHLGDPTKAPDGKWIDPHANCEMLIYVARASCSAGCDNLERIKTLRALAPDVPLMILSDGKNHEEIISRLNVGAQGFVHVGANAELALQALSFVLKYGSFFPSAMPPKHAYPAPRHSAIDCTTSHVMNWDNDPAKNVEEPARNRRLTARQKAVIELVGRGDTNKVIARRLGLTEGTVKVHVRQIMRKLGVTNRTQVAIVCANGQPDPSQEAAIRPPLS
jgi:DNA-binding NarL/FixJ family response regulator